MKALLLAAGLGTRLRPLTENMPKCLVPINGRPLLLWWFDLLEEHNVDEVVINLHHLPEQVQAEVEQYSGRLEIRLVHEGKLLGSAGTIHANREYFADEEQFFILYADNLTDVNLTALADFNKRHSAPLTVGLFHAEDPSACGIAELGQEGRIVAFTEKPENPSGDLASAGMFVARPELFDYLRPVSTPWDFGRHVMPELVGRMNGVLVDGYIRDIGTHESLSRAEKEWKERRGH